MSRSGRMVAGLLTALAISGGVMGVRALRERRRPDADDAQLRALTDRVALLERRLRERDGTPRVVTVREGDEHLVVPAAPTATETADKGVAPGRPDRPVPRTSTDEAALEREYFGELDERLANEPPDPTWAVATEHRFRESTEPLRSQVRLDTARCGRSICRLDVAIADPSQDAIQLRRFLSAGSNILPEALVRDGDKPGRYVVYFGRSGEFPPMQPPAQYRRGERAAWSPPLAPAVTLPTLTPEGARP